MENELALNAEYGNYVASNYIQRKASCFACGHNPCAAITLPSAARSTLQDLLLAVDAELKLSGPSLGVPGQVPWTRPDDLQANAGRAVTELLEGYTGALALTHPIFGSAIGKGLSVSFSGP